MAYLRNLQGPRKACALDHAALEIETSPLADIHGEGQLFVDQGESLIFCLCGSANAEGVTFGKSGLIFSQILGNQLTLLS
jgi:hypothetical protein